MLGYDFQVSPQTLPQQAPVFDLEEDRQQQEWYEVQKGHASQIVPEDFPVILALGGLSPLRGGRKPGGVHRWPYPTRGVGVGDATARARSASVGATTDSLEGVRQPPEVQTGSSTILLSINASRTCQLGHHSPVLVISNSGIPGTPEATRGLNRG